MFNASLFRALVCKAFADGQLTRATRDVALALLTFAGRRSGLCWPGRAAIAARACCKPRTVDRALPVLRRLGLLDWRQRRQAWNRCDTNVYQLAATVRKYLEKGLSVGMSLGSPRALDAGELAALDRLGRAVGVEPAALFPWLFPNRPGFLGAGEIAEG